MPVAPYYPVEEGQQLLWFRNLLTKMPSYETALGLTTGEATALYNDLNYLIWTWQMWLPAWRSYVKSTTEFRDSVAKGKGTAPLAVPPVPAFTVPTAVRPGALDRLFASIARWKRAAGYSTDLGKDLGLIGPEKPVHADPPTLKLRGHGQGWVEMNFNVWEHDGIWIESRRQGAEAWGFLAIDTARPYRDTRPNLPEQPTEWREYRACWWDASTPTLAFGPALRANVGS